MESHSGEDPDPARSLSMTLERSLRRGKGKGKTLTPAPSDRFEGGRDSSETPDEEYFCTAAGLFAGSGGGKPSTALLNIKTRFGHITK